MQLTFSIICPVYNREYLLQKAIESVINQMYIDWELIIVDDGSVDNTKVVVEKYLSDNRIKYFYQRNQGPSIARNYGIQNAKGSYICFLDSDDLYFVNHLKVFYDIICSPSYNREILCSNWMIINEVKRMHINKLIIETESLSNKIYFVLRNDISINNLCIPIGVFENIKFEGKYNFFEDTHLLVRIVINFNCKILNDVTVIINYHNLRSSNLIYQNKKAIYSKIENNISAIKDLFDKVGSEILRITNKPYLREYLVSEKYIHHSNGALIYGMPLISFQLILKAIKSDPKLFHIKYYFKYFLKYPIYSIYYFLKSKL